MFGGVSPQDTGRGREESFRFVILNGFTHSFHLESSHIPANLYNKFPLYNI